MLSGELKAAASKLQKEQAQRAEKERQRLEKERILAERQRQRQQQREEEARAKRLEAAAAAAAVSTLHTWHISRRSRHYLLQAQQQQQTMVLMNIADHAALMHVRLAAYGNLCLCLILTRFPISFGYCRRRSVTSKT
jgi:phosphate starvation-inducible protein PhoH